MKKQLPPSNVITKRPTFQICEGLQSESLYDEPQERHITEVSYVVTKKSIQSGKSSAASPR